MEEEQHHQHQHHHHYGGGGSSTNNTPAMADLRQFFSPIPTHHQFPAPPSLFSPAAAAAAFPHHYDSMMLVMGGGAHGIHDFRSDNSAAVSMVPASSVAGASGGGFDMENAGGGGVGGGFGLGVGGGDGGATARWPRQETLTLLEIRSRLDHKFKEANHKGPLWDEVSRIMSAEHGYERSGKKCREKFENLYKYYKKTKEGKAGRQDGKHYRFFRQLEALYGESAHHPNPISNHTHLNMISNHNATTATAAATAPFQNTMMMHRQEGNFQSISVSNTSSDFDTSSSEGNDEADIVGSTEINGGDSSMDMVGRNRKRRGGGRSWKAKVREFIDSQMRRIMEKQEAWLEKMMRSLESKEKERMAREEEWRKREAARMEREHKFWAKERAWIEARDKALMDALQRITGKEVGNLVESDNLSQHGQEVEEHDEEEEEGNNNGDVNDDRWGESEIIKLVEVRASIQARFDECGGGPEESDLWEEISTRMGCLGHDRTPKMCKDKWNFITKELSQKRKSHQYQQHQDHHHHLQTTNLLYNYGHHEMNEQGGMGLGPPQLGLSGGGGGGGGNPMNDSCLRILLGGDGGETNPWESYGVKLSKGDQTH